MLARFACVLPLLLLPTTLMGASLPLLAEHAARSTRDAERAAPLQAGLLYALNTLGAVAGTVLGSFVLMPSIGVRATNLAAVGINLALGVAVLIAARRTPAPCADGAHAAESGRVAGSHPQDGALPSSRLRSRGLRDGLRGVVSRSARMPSSLRCSRSR